MVAGFGAGILAAAVIAAVVLVMVQPSGQPLKYAGMPAPCIMITSATLTKYLPGATSSQQGVSARSDFHGGACTWSSITSQEDRTLAMQVGVYGSSAGVTTARHQYAAAIPASCQCHGYTIATQSVTGLGDEATAVFTSYAVGSANGNAGTVELLVRSGNADIFLGYSASPVVSSAPPPGKPALLAVTVAMARDVLAALASPPTAQATSASSTPAASPSSLGPQYAAPHDWCTLVKASTLARYAPGSVANPVPQPTATSSSPITFATCTWGGPSASIVLNIRLYPQPTDAQQSFEFDSQDRQRAGSGIAFVGARAVKGLGQQAVAINQTYEDVPGKPPAVELFVWSGNAEIDVAYSGLTVDGPPPTRATILAGDIAMARDILAALPT